MSVTVSTTVSAGTNTNTSTNTNTNSSDIIQSSTNEGGLFFSGDLTAILKNASAVKNSSQEALAKSKNLNSLIKNFKLSAAQVNSLNYFLVYGSQNTVKIGIIERAACLASYIGAFSKAPVNEAQWNDLLSICSGSEPSAHSAKAETQAKSEFKKVYNRNADMNNSADIKAIAYISYGLKPLKRNITSEAKAIQTFRSVYKHVPVNNLAWNIVRAIAYSGVVK
jgi:hypothetical protein